MSEFAFLFRGGNPSVAPAEQQQRTMQKWQAWMKELHDKGMITNPGHPLERKGHLVSGRSKIVNDSPFVEVKDIINGFIVIDAADLDEAVQISKGCPILDVDGAVEVRPVRQFNPQG